MSSLNVKPNLNNLSGDKVAKEVEIVLSQGQILNKLLDQFEPLDFKLLAYPQLKKLEQEAIKLKGDPDKLKVIEAQITALKVKYNHKLIIPIDNLLRVAKLNNWGIAMHKAFIYLYNGSYWEQIDKDQFKNFLGKSAQKMGVEKFTAKHYEYRDKLHKQFLASAYLPTPEMESGKVLINLLNGTFEVTPNNNKLREFDRKDFITYQLPFEYNEKAKAPLFQKYLDRVLPDISRQQILAEYLGFVFIKHGSKVLKEEKALVLFGTGANGKSVFFEVVNALLGQENTSNYTLQSLTNENGYYRAKIANKLVNYASEINANLEAAMFKQLVSGEPVEARLPYGEPFTLKQYAKLIFNSNELPKDVEQTNAFFRRFLIVPFDVTIPSEEQDKSLHTKIIDSELSGVFNWVLQGLERLMLQKGFTHSEAVNKALDNYRSESNSVKLFLEESQYKKHHESYQLIRDIYPKYRAFCIEDGMSPFKKVNFKKQMESMGFVTDRESGTGQNIIYIIQEGFLPNFN